MTLLLHLEILRSMVEHSDLVLKLVAQISPILHFAAQERALYMAEPLKQWVTTAQFDFSGMI